MVSRERVQRVLDRVRPFLQADGGDIELMSVHGNSADVRLDRHVRRLSERAYNASRRGRSGDS
jgi:hypothetical protein